MPDVPKINNYLVNLKRHFFYERRKRTLTGMVYVGTTRGIHLIATRQNLSCQRYWQTSCIP